MMAGVLLAAGASTRMGAPKALAAAGRESFLVRGVRNLWSACDAVMVVLGSRAPVVRRRAELEFEQLVNDGRLQADLQKARSHGSRGLEAHFVVNRGWQKGMLSSAREGLRAALAVGPEAVLVMPVDHPDVNPRTVAMVGELMHEAMKACRTPRERKAFAYALMPRFDGLRGHPLAISPALAVAIVKDKKAEDLSDAVRRHARLVGYVDVADAGVVRNRNTPKD